MNYADNLICSGSKVINSKEFNQKTVTTVSCDWLQVNLHDAELLAAQAGQWWQHHWVEGFLHWSQWSGQRIPSNETNGHMSVTKAHLHGGGGIGWRSGLERMDSSWSTLPKICYAWMNTYQNMWSVLLMCSVVKQPYNHMQSWDWWW